MENQTEKIESKTNNSNNNKYGKIILIIVIILVVGAIAFFWLIWPSINNTITNSDHSSSNGFGSPEGTWKPIIYIYPKTETNIKITVSHPESFTVTYPKYNNGWEVKALPDGTLIDKNNRKYYALYWEDEHYGNNKIKEDGFIVKGEDVASFLEEKLEFLGLNYKEKEEFIVYWLPKLEKNKYNYIRFQTMEEINNNMELFIEPKPDTLIRVLMEYKPLSEKINIKSQELTKVERTGYTVVEWGGTKIN